jgi:hypothetical protein
MANKLYPKWKEAVMQAASNSSLGGTVKALLVNTTGPGTTYTYDDAHQFLSDVPAGARISTSGALANKTFANGVFDADDTTFPLVSGDVSEAIILYIDTGVAGTSRLVAYIDTGITGAPVTPGGSDINVVFDNGANKIFAL